MKLSGTELTGFLRQPPSTVAAVLLYGPDEGLVRERADTLTRSILGGILDDPFRLTHLTGEQVRQDPARLADEAASLSLMGGRRVVRVREAGDALSKPLDPCLVKPNQDCLILIEAGDLAKSSSLRKRAESEAVFAAIACYADGPREVAALIREMTGRDRIQIDGDAVAYLTASLGVDRGITRQEIEKLVLYAGPGGKITLDDAIGTVGDTRALVLDDVIYDAFDAKIAGVDGGLNRLFLEGVAPVQVIRAAQRHGHRLHRVACAIRGGETPDGAIKTLRPPVFFKYADRFRQQVTQWPEPRINRALRLLTQTELDCKTTGYPDVVICRQILCLMGRLPGRPTPGRPTRRP